MRKTIIALIFLIAILGSGCLETEEKIQPLEKTFNNETGKTEYKSQQYGFELKADSFWKDFETNHPDTFLLLSDTNNYAIIRIMRHGTNYENQEQVNNYVTSEE